MNRYTLLIADDEAFIREGLKDLAWDTIGIEICAIANNGKEAIDLAGRYKPDLILTDIRMPIVDGLTMAEEFLKQNNRCKIIFLSGYEDFSYVRRALQMGAFDYILKPASPDEILTICRKAIAQITAETKNGVQPLSGLERADLGADTRFDQEAQDEGRINVKEIIHFIEEHYRENLTLSLLAEKFNFNSIYINRMLKRETGFTFLENLTNKRMSEAVRLLENTDWKLGKIAEAVGVPDQRYFSTLFKKYYSCSPKQYRQKSRREIL